MDGLCQELYVYKKFSIEMAADGVAWKKKTCCANFT